MWSSMPEVQRKGINMIYYDESKGGEVPKSPALNFQMTAHNFFEILPGNLSSIHLCLHSSPGSLALHNSVLHRFLKALPQSSRTRARLHYGSDQERQYHLRGYGIPIDKFPADENGNIHTEVQNATCCHDYLEDVFRRSDNNNKQFTGTLS